MGMAVGPSGGPNANMNVTPLIDVMLVLLVIFIITAPLLTQAVKLELPKAKAQPADTVIGRLIAGLFNGRFRTARATVRSLLRAPMADDLREIIAALKIGGVTIAHPKGLAGHSDGDVAAHAVGGRLAWWTAWTTGLSRPAATCSTTSSSSRRASSWTSV